jgi:hypothetical protein
MHDNGIRIDIALGLCAALTAFWASAAAQKVVAALSVKAINKHVRGCIEFSSS